MIYLIDDTRHISREIYFSYRSLIWHYILPLDIMDFGVILNINVSRETFSRFRGKMFHVKQMVVVF